MIKKKLNIIGLIGFIAAIIAIYGFIEKRFQEDAKIVELKKIIKQWEESWENQDEKKYKSFYCSQFQGKAKVNGGFVKRDRWILNKVKHWAGCYEIILEITDFDFKEINKKKIIITFKQKYWDDKRMPDYDYGSEVIKELHFSKNELNNWLIICEKPIKYISKWKPKRG